MSTNFTDKELGDSIYLNRMMRNRKLEKLSEKSKPKIVIQFYFQGEEYVDLFEDNDYHEGSSCFSLFFSFLIIGFLLNAAIVFIYNMFLVI